MNCLGESDGVLLILNFSVYLFNIQPGGVSCHILSNCASHAPDKTIVLWGHVIFNIFNILKYDKRLKKVVDLKDKHWSIVCSKGQFEHLRPNGLWRMVNITDPSLNRLLTF